QERTAEPEVCTMRNQDSPCLPRTRETRSRVRRTDLADWRRSTRPLLLDDFVDRTRDLSWSRELVDLLLDELHVSDEFDDLIDRIPPAQINYPQLVAFALVLRHSWFPEDLARITAALEPPSSPASFTHESLRAADAGLTSHALSTQPACTTQKGGTEMLTNSPPPAPRGHRVRELVCGYRPLRDGNGHIVDVPTLVLSNPRIAAATLGPLLAHQPVELFAVACLSTKHRLLAWHVLSRGTRDSTPVSMPDVFVPACVTPDTTGLIVVHNHRSGDPTPGPDDARLTLRLCAARRRSRHRPARSPHRGRSPPLLQLPRKRRTEQQLLVREMSLNRSGHHVARLCGVPRSRQASSLRSDPFGAYGLDRTSGAPTEGNYVMARGFGSDVVRRSHDFSGKT